MIDDVHVERHPLVLGEQIGNADRRDGDHVARVAGKRHPDKIQFDAG